ncbi:MAG TPA: MAPEG family protein [Cyanothece sp. UBA12306]|nr:MAPEG family protein [Cyanothece sp. UBA12306]
MNWSTSAIVLYSIFLGSILIYVPFLAVGYARFQLGYDRSSPRGMFEQLPPYAQRATWAHQNAFETFMVYAGAALMAYVTGVDSRLAAGAAIVFVGARLFYPLFYIFDLPWGRTLMFATGQLCTYTLFILSFLQIQ